MHRMMLFLGMGTALVGQACSGAPALPLALAATRNAAETVRTILERGSAADERDGGLTPLMWAARAGAIDAMQALLDAGADPDARDTRRHWTPLLHAIHRQHPAAVRLLLDRGADPNVAATRRLTPPAVSPAPRNAVGVP